MAIYVAICILFLLVGSNSCEEIEAKNEYKYLAEMIEQQKEQMTIFKEEIKRQDERIRTLIEEAKQQDRRIQDLNQETKQEDGRIQELNQETKRQDGRIQELNQETQQQDGRIQELNQDTKRQNEKIQELSEKAKRQEEQMKILKLEMKQLSSENTFLKNQQQKEGNNDNSGQEDNENGKPIIVDDRIEKRLLLDDPGHLQFEIDQLKASVRTLTSTKGGALYVQWGRKRCTGNDTETVYSGYAGGSKYSHTGGAAEYVCAPSDPDFGKYIPAQYSTYLFGAEYETNYFGQPWNEDVPCAVCRSTVATTALMIPGKNHCYQDWTVEYRGRLASGHYTHAAASQYVCVDGHPEAIISGDANKDGKLFYPVISECGSLPCPPYKNNTELLCVVCSK